MVAIRVVLGREVVDGGVLVEVVGRVGFTLGGSTVSDIIVGVGLVLAGGKLVADAIGILTVVDKNTTADEEGCPPL